MKNKLSILIFAIMLTKSAFAQFTFVHITDLHVADGLSAGGYDLNGVMFFQVKNEINNLIPKPTFVVATGDISHAGDYGSDGMYPAFTQYLYPNGIVNPNVGDCFIDSLQTIPIYFTPGNHDFRYTNTPPLGSTITKYMSYLCSVLDYFVVYQNAVIICMNSGYDDLRPLWEDTNYMSPESSGFTNSQLIWLRGVLSANSTKKKIILMHSPPVNVVGTYCDGTAFSGNFVDLADGSIKYNRDVFLNICDSNHVDVVLAGHAHQNVVVSRLGVIVDENWTDSTRYVQTGAALDGCYRKITVDSNFVYVGYPQSVQVVSIKEIYISKIEIYPNPAIDKISITNNEISIETRVFIYEIQGSQIRDYKFWNQNKIELDISTFKKGIYLVKIQTDKIVTTKKLIII